jgi:phage-related protein
MNTKYFSLGFTAMDSVITGVSAAKRGIIHAVKSPVHGAQDAAQAVKTGVLNTSEVVTSFLAGAKQAIEYRRGTCRMLTYDGLSNEE